MNKRNEILEIFRLKMTMLLSQWVEKMKMFMIENRIIGLDAEALKKMRKDPLSKWSMEKEVLNRAIKREVAGLINKTHKSAYMKGIE